MSSEFEKRHIGPDDSQVKAMLRELGCESLDQLSRDAVPASIKIREPLKLDPALSEFDVLRELREMGQQNEVRKSHIGLGYFDCITPPVIQRTILENPGWYTQYTPYQAEISQGRLEALLNFQTMVSDLTGLPVSNASLLDEATAAAEAMSLSFHVQPGKTERHAFFVSNDCLPQSIEVVRTRAEPLGWEVIVGDPFKHDFNAKPVFGVLLQYPAADGSIHDYSEVISRAHAAGSIVTMSCDLLSLALLKSPGELGADVAIGSAQRFGVSLGYGGPHAAFLSTKDEFKRQIPGRIVGVSVDADGKPALRLALQTREQHIRRAKATSNICTAQVLLAIMASMYAVYHGPEGLRKIARRVHGLAGLLRDVLSKNGLEVSETFFDTLTVHLSTATRNEVLIRANQTGINLRTDGVTSSDSTLGISLDETTNLDDIKKLVSIFTPKADISKITLEKTTSRIPKTLERKSEFLTHPVFNQYHSETELLRYIKRLEAKDLSLTTSMIPLGSCTMKLNAAAEMQAVTWPGFAGIHPFAPLEQALGYKRLINGLEKQLCDLTGFDACSLQPNAGSQGEYAGLLVIRKYLKEKGGSHRNICLIPTSAHGTNPASAVMAGMEIVTVACDDQGNIDIPDLKAKALEHSKDLAALMVTYPSTHGVFEEAIVEICEIIHKAGGQVYMDGANLNAQVGLCKPGEFGPDVCHINLHKTFCIPHGGGGPGMGPICVKKHLAPYLPSHPLIKTGGEKAITAISAAPFGSASILPISYAYIRMMGADGLTRATQTAILNANYIAKRLDPHFPVLYKGKKGFVAHECIVDLRPMKAASGVEVEDVAKRLMDYGFHAPTVSFPVVGTLMIEPTESESKRELDRFCDAMIAIRNEAREIEQGKAPREGNVLKGAPHTARAVTADSWTKSYSREKAAFPASWLNEHKFWPPVSRINNPYGDRNLICSCPPIEEFIK